MDFSVGYSPNNGRALVDFLSKQGFKDNEIKAAGLGTMRHGGFSDMFIGRLMVALTDVQGRIVGFTARQLEDDPNSPKYINTPTTPIYDKGRQVFGLHLAKQAIRKDGFAVVVEGNLDVLASHQVGVKNVVATAGTAMTEAHLKLLARFTRDVRLAFDADQAGQAATERVIPLAQKTGTNINIITIKQAKDPDELIQRDPKLWQAAIEKPQYAVDWLIDRYKDQLDLTSGLGKRQFSDIVMHVVSNLNDAVEQDHYIHLLSAEIGVSPDALRSKLKNKDATPRRRLAAVKVAPPSDIEQQKTEGHFMSLMLMRPDLRENFTSLTADMFSVESAKQLFIYLLEHLTFEWAGHMPEQLKAYDDYGKILLFQFEELYQNLEIQELRYEAARLKVKLIEQFVKTKKAALMAIMQTASEQDMPNLLTQAKQLDEILKNARTSI